MENMELTKLTAISPIDGRYRDKCEVLADYFSEYALIRYRVLVEVEYFIALCELPLPQLAGVDTAAMEKLRDVYRDFSEADALRVKEIEQTTNHDVKAVEYLIKEKMDGLGLQPFKEFVHFGLTSQDINNTAIPYSLKEATNDVYYPLLEELIAKLVSLAKEWARFRCWPIRTDSPHRPRNWARRYVSSWTGSKNSSRCCGRFRPRRSSAARPATSTHTWRPIRRWIGWRSRTAS